MNKMAKTHLLIAFLILEVHVYIEAAPNESNKEQMEPIVVEPITEIPQEGVEESSESLQGQRQKRWYSYSGYGPYYPRFPPRDPPPLSNVYYDDALTEIHRRLKSIISYVQEPIPQPPPLAPPVFPIFFPSFFLPQSGCNCFPGNLPQPDNKPSPSPVEPTKKRPIPKNNGTVPDFKERGKDTTSDLTPLLDDETVDENLNIDSSRPISFEPIPPNRPNRPPPPVEHGSSQAGVDIPPTQVSPVTPAEDLEPITPPSKNYIPDSNLTPCDGAILSCCHQSFVTFNCFVSQGCTDPASYGDPCDTDIIAQVIGKFQRHYTRRTG